jgi:hypothetical protein
MVVLEIESHFLPSLGWPGPGSFYFKFLPIAGITGMPPTPRFFQLRWGFDNFFCLGRTWTLIFPISASQAASIIGMSHWSLTCFFKFFNYIFLPLLESCPGGYREQVHCATFALSVQVSTLIGASDLKLPVSGPMIHRGTWLPALLLISGDLITPTVSLVPIAPGTLTFWLFLEHYISPHPDSRNLLGTCCSP